MHRMHSVCAVSPACLAGAALSDVCLAAICLYRRRRLLHYGFFDEKGAFHGLSRFYRFIDRNGTGVLPVMGHFHPDILCGRDLRNRRFNNLWTAKAMPGSLSFRKSRGDFLEPIIGLTPPQWSLIWFFIFAVVFVRIMRRG